MPHADAVKFSVTYGKRPTSTTPIEPMGVTVPNGTAKGCDILAMFPPGALAPNEQPLQFVDQGVEYELSRNFPPSDGGTKCVFILKMKVTIDP